MMSPENIYRYFRERDDGDFYLSREDPRHSRFILLPEQIITIVYSTKSIFPETFLEECRNNGVMIVGTGGLPSDYSMQLLNEYNSFFFGDLDAADLLIFAWIRAQIPRLRHLGIGDFLISALGLMNVQRLWQKATPSELEAIATFGSSFSDFEDIVGAVAIQSVRHGAKIEVEAIFSNLLDIRLVQSTLSQQFYS